MKSGFHSQFTGVGQNRKVPVKKLGTIHVSMARPGLEDASKDKVKLSGEQCVNTGDAYHNYKRTATVAPVGFGQRSMTPLVIGQRKSSFDKTEIWQDKSAEKIKDQWKKLDIGQAKESSLMESIPVIREENSIRSIPGARQDYSNIKEVVISNFETQYMPNGFYMFSKLSKNGCLNTEMSTVGIIPNFPQTPTSHNPRATTLSPIQKTGRILKKIHSTLQKTLQPCNVDYDQKTKVPQLPRNFAQSSMTDPKKWVKTDQGFYNLKSKFEEMNLLSERKGGDWDREYGTVYRNKGSAFIRNKKKAREKG